MKMTRPGPDAWWALPAEALLCRLGSNASGLTQAQAVQRAATRRASRRGTGDRRSFAWCVLTQLRSPLQLILVVGGAIAALVQEWTDAAVITGIVFIGAFLAAWHEYR